MAQSGAQTTDFDVAVGHAAGLDALKEVLFVEELSFGFDGRAEFALRTEDTPAFVINNESGIGAIVGGTGDGAFGWAVAAEAAEFPDQLEIGVIIYDGLGVGDFLAVFQPIDA
jgi:hypothetical protein